MNDFSFALSRRFAPLFITQFLGALNDNLFKTAVFVLITYHALGQNPSLPPAQLLNIGALLFILPYFLFSSISGEISTKFDKGKVARVIKILEILIMMVVAYGLYTSSTIILLTCLFFMGAQSTLFGPLKYAIIPDYLKKNELIAGNGLIETGTFIAILLGQIIGTAMVKGGIWLMCALVIVIAILGTVSSFFMPNVPATNPKAKINLNIAKSSTALIKGTMKNSQLRASIIGISWFWFIGAVYTTQLPTFVQFHLGGNDNVFNLLLTMFSIGIGLGSIICAKICHGQLNLRLVIYGGIGITIFGLILSFLTLNTYASEVITLKAFLSQAKSYYIVLSVLLIGFFGGFYSVPLYTWLQVSAHEEIRANSIACNNIINALFMVTAALLSAVLLAFYKNISFLYLITTMANLIFVFFLLKISPQIWQKPAKNNDIE